MAASHQGNFNKVLNSLYGHAIARVTRLSSIEDSAHHIQNNPLGYLGDLPRDLRTECAPFSDTLYIAECCLNSGCNSLATERNDPTIAFDDSNKLVRTKGNIDRALTTRRADKAISYRSTISF
jgi:hypothetical protein